MPNSQRAPKQKLDVMKKQWYQQKRPGNVPRTKPVANIMIIYSQLNSTLLTLCVVIYVKKTLNFEGKKKKKNTKLRNRNFESKIFQI